MIIVERYLHTDDKPVEGELVEVIEYEGLPGDFDFNSIQEYLESEKAFEITNSYYHLDRQYSHTERGAGGSEERILLQIWNEIPAEVKVALMLKILNLATSLGKKIVQKNKRRKIEKYENDRLYKQYGFKTDIVEVVEVEKTDVRITTYRKY